VLVYDRDPQTERLTRRGQIDLRSGPDNIDVDADGNLWIAAHPKLLRVLAHQKNASELSPSQVLRVSPDGKVEEIYMNGGEQVSAASVAAVSGKRMLIGEIFDDGFLDCTIGG
jgi:arylesterase/paraoxonase